MGDELPDDTKGLIAIRVTVKGEVSAMGFGLSGVEQVGALSWAHHQLLGGRTDRLVQMARVSGLE